MKLRDIANWIKEKITGKKTEETSALMQMIATEEEIEKAKEMDRKNEVHQKRIADTAWQVRKRTEHCKTITTNNGRRRKGIPMVRRRQLLRAEWNHSVRPLTGGNNQRGGRI